MKNAAINVLVHVTLVHMRLCFCRMSPGDGFADQRVGVSLEFLDSANV